LADSDCPVTYDLLVDLQQPAFYLDKIVRHCCGRIRFQVGKRLRLSRYTNRQQPFDGIDSKGSFNTLAPASLIRFAVLGFIHSRHRFFFG
jgi:hypothetical protein